MCALLRCIIIFTSLIAGALFNQLIDTEILAGGGMEEHSSWWAILCSVIFLILLSYFAIDRIYQWIRSKRRPKSSNSITVNVDGMTCMGCVKKLQTHLEKLATVEKAEISLSKNQATIHGTPTLAEIKEVIQSAGFIYSNNLE